MKIEKLSASSYNLHQGCAHAFFLEYVLGWRGPSSVAAAKGNVVHTVLEVLAKVKKDGYPVKSKTMGEILEPTSIENLTSLSYLQHKILEPDIGWKDTPKELEECTEWVHKVLNFNNGTFSPTNLDIIDIEKYFSIEIKEDWATTANGYLKLNGFIDLIVKNTDDFYGIIDWKTGKRQDFYTGKEKDEENLRHDIQLLIYYLAAKTLYPNVPNFEVTIFYINSGGPYTIPFDESAIIEVKSKIQRKFEDICSTKYPLLNKTWRCKNFCHQSKSSFDGTNVEPMIEFREDKFQPVGAPMSKCDQVDFMMKTHGEEWVNENMRKIK